MCMMKVNYLIFFYSKKGIKFRKKRNKQVKRDVQCSKGKKTKKGQMTSK
jgi:hypothetical protein